MVVRTERKSERRVEEGQLIETDGITCGVVDRVSGYHGSVLEENELAYVRKEDVLGETSLLHIVESDLDVVEDELNLYDFDLTRRGDVESVLVSEED